MGNMLPFLAAFLLASSARAAPWLYQLQNPNPRAVLKSGFRAAVLDYSRDGSDAGRLPSRQVKALHRAGIRALAYLSIGEAENYRFYWQSDWVGRNNSNAFSASAPTWLGHTNPDWRGNYKVRYWDPDWRENVLRPYLDRITRQGFGGVYLDIIDAYEYWAAPASYGAHGETFRAGDPRGDKADAARRMIDLVVWIAQSTRASAGRRFLVFPQNGEEILRYDSDGRYRRAISGIGVEDLFYNETARQPANETRDRLRFLRKLRAAGKKVLCVDYVDTGDRGDATNAARIADFVARCRAEGFDFYVAREDRELDRINRVPGVQP
jgi:cysteinyl-tRNA synthetase